MKVGPGCTSVATRPSLHPAQTYAMGFLHSTLNPEPSTLNRNKIKARFNQITPEQSRLGMFSASLAGWIPGYCRGLGGSGLAHTGQTERRKASGPRALGLGFSKGIGVWARIHRKTHNATSCDLGFSKGIGVWARIHRKTHNATSCELGFSKGIGVWARIHRKTHNATNCELGFSKRNRIHCRRFA